MSLTQASHVLDDKIPFMIFKRFFIIFDHAKAHVFVGRNIQPKPVFVTSPEEPRDDFFSSTKLL